MSLPENNRAVGIAIVEQDAGRATRLLPPLAAEGFACHAVLNRSMVAMPEADEALMNGPISLDLDRHRVSVHGTQTALTPTEFRMLREIVSARGNVVTRARLVDAVFGTSDPGDRKVDVHMTSLRRKLGAAGEWIRTIRGVGYAYRQPQSLEAGSSA